MLKSKIKVILVENEIKQNELADKLGFKPQTLSSWITNTNTPTLNNAFKLAKELGCKVDDLWDYKEDIDEGNSKDGNDGDNQKD